MNLIGLTACGRYDEPRLVKFYSLPALTINCELIGGLTRKNHSFIRKIYTLAAKR